MISFETFAVIAFIYISVQISNIDEKIKKIMGDDDNDENSCTWMEEIIKYISFISVCCFIYWVFKT